jgi:uncharacterized repeat protein (TIGR03806 family)
MLRVVLGLLITGVVLWAAAPPRRPTITGSPELPPPYTTRRVFADVPLKSPVYVGSHRRHPGLLVAELAGTIRRLHEGKAHPFLAEKDIEFYSFTFHPKYDDNGQFFVFANGPASAKSKRNQILRYTVKPGADVPDPASRTLILEWTSNGHNGGDLGFGLDGMLYLSSGDGTTDSDEGNTGQDLRDLNSGILRIDVDRPTPGKPYAIPRDNPFLDRKEARGELWAFGLRNPWRIHFDGPDLYIGDVGQDLREMVYLGKRGANYGWSLREGTAEFHPHRVKGPGDFVDPLIEHMHSESRSLTGGVVYRGKRFPGLVGTYLYGDYSTGRIWGLRQKDGKVTHRMTLADTRLRVIGFGNDTAGEVFILCHGGELHALEKAEKRPVVGDFPRTLSATGLFTAEGTPYPSMVPYTINAPLWSDGSDKERWMLMPVGSSIRYHEKEPWKFPDGSIFVKTFAIDTPKGRRKIETRIMVQERGEWAGYSYAWNDAQTDATLVEAEGRDTPYRQVIDGQTRDLKWHYPSRVECMVCHTRAAGFVLGMSTVQANRAGQLERWTRAGLLKLPKSDKPLPQLTDYTDDKAPLESRVRSYLHGNCAHCHVWAGGGNSAIDLHGTTPRDKMKLIDVVPLHDKFGLKDAKLVAPGDPERSVLLSRLIRRGRGQMPPLGTHHTDPQGVKLVRQWIESLAK